MKFKTLSLAAASLLAVAIPAAAQTGKAAYGTWGVEMKDIHRAPSLRNASDDRIRDHVVATQKDRRGPHCTRG